jgi:hypothetical protein
MLLPSSAASGLQKPYVLTALTSIGTVYWRYDCVHYRAPAWSLGIRVFRNSATTRVTYRDAGLTQRRTAQPDGPTVWFPFRRERAESLSFVQRTEPRTLHGRVLTKFGRHSCQSYIPPRLTVELYPG